MERGGIFVAKKAGARIEAAARGYAFNAVAASAGAFYAGVHTNACVAHFAGIEMRTADLMTVHHSARGNAGANIYINIVTRNAAYAPHPFGTGGALHIIINRAGQTELLFHIACERQWSGAPRVYLVPYATGGVYAPDHADAHGHRRFARGPAYGLKVVANGFFHDLDGRSLVHIARDIFFMAKYVTKFVDLANE